MSDDKPSTAIVPFGKYKGKPIEALRADRSYLDWLMGQDWFRERYSGLFQIIINNFGEPAETPEHNRIQARFLDDAFCHAFFSGFKGTAWIVKPRTAITNRIAQIQKQLNELPNRFFMSEYGRKAEEESVAKELAKAKLHLADFDAEPPARPYPITFRREFEVNGWDILLGAGLQLERWGIHESQIVYIEIKPSLGDDFPAVLRQMKGNKVTEYIDSGRWNWFVLIIDQFTAMGATLAQVQEIFRTAGFAVVTLATIESRMDKVA